MTYKGILFEWAILILIFQQGTGVSIGHLDKPQKNDRRLHQKPLLETTAASISLSSIYSAKENVTSTYSKPNDGDVNTCPRDSQVDKGRNFCYWESSDSKVHLSWTDAQKYCKKYGGDLASFHSKEEENIALAKRHGIHWYWIGLRYDGIKQEYEWADKTPLNYTHWAAGQPDEDKRLGCAFVDKMKGWTLNYCGVLKEFICKFPTQTSPPELPSPTAETLTKCDKDKSEYYFNGYCYQWSSEKIIWHNAQALCERDGGNLVSVHSSEEIEFLIKMIFAVNASLGSVQRIWIGLDSFGPRCQFQWSDRSPFGFTNWEIGEPKNYREKCVTMDPKDAMWGTKNCNAHLNFICKRRNGTAYPIVTPSATTPPIRGFCQEGWRMFGDRCFRLYGVDGLHRLTREEAEYACRHKGGDLASVRNGKDQAFLYYLMQNAKMDTWIGLHDLETHGQFYWNDNSPYNYEHWATGEPRQNRKWEENCVVIGYENRTVLGGWKDIECNKRLPYLCQIPRDPSITSDPTASESECPGLPDYVKRNTSCYKVYHDRLSWEKAEKICFAKKGYLVYISDLEVEAFVNYIAAESLNEDESFWIGLHFTHKNTLVWDDGDSLGFSRFKKVLDFLHGGKCVYSTLSTALWDRAKCSDQKKFICEIKVGVINVPPGEIIALSIIFIAFVGGSAIILYRYSRWSRKHIRFGVFFEEDDEEQATSVENQLNNDEPNVNISDTQALYTKT